MVCQSLAVVSAWSIHGSIFVGVVIGGSRETFSVQRVAPD
jgi:hypothetical protein